MKTFKTHAIAFSDYLAFGSWQVCDLRKGLYYHQRYDDKLKKYVTKSVNQIYEQFEKGNKS
jgi:hypothetical protein